MIGILVLLKRYEHKKGRSARLVLRTDGGGYVELEGEIFFETDIVFSQLADLVTMLKNAMQEQETKG